MDHLSSRSLESFKMAVGTKFQLYNSLFTSLPFHRIEKTGILLSLFLNHCEENFKKQLSPSQIVEEFFEKYTYIKAPQDRMDLLFRFVQYAERQVVLFDAVEDAAFDDVNDLSGQGTLKQLLSRVSEEHKDDELAKKLESYGVTLVLTAHPTQFYPGSVLGIINDLSKSLKANDAVGINTYLQQLGKTPLFKKQKPTPYDEAISLVWYLENVFFYAIGRVLSALKKSLPQIDLEKNPVIRMGFWPGGDRDGNPNVTAETTLRVAQSLHSSIIKSYYLEIRRLKRRLTFRGVDTLLADLEVKLYNYTFLKIADKPITKDDVLKPLQEIREILIYEHNNLFLPLVQNLINKVHAFGVHFASLDIRQESSIHTSVIETIAEKSQSLRDYMSLSAEEKLDKLCMLEERIDENEFSDITKETLLSIDAIREIQNTNGEQGCHRYIISQCQSAVNVLEVYALFLLRGWKKEDISIDIVPLFETVDDLENAPAIMNTLYQNPVYAAHLKRGGNKQVIMVGFSDGTKDGGYLMANWGIFKAKSELTRISRENGVSVVFFDGRGGPPARGGGKTHKYYSSVGKAVSTDEIQLTVQGQTVSSSFGIISSAQYNIEQLLNAGIVNDIFSESDQSLQPEQQEVVKELADISYQSYRELKDHPDFLDYLSEISPLKYYADTNVSSRPSKRKQASRLSLKDLRAIPFVGAWSQIKQNVPGYYGLGTALETIESRGKFAVIKRIYEHSGYFKTLIDNCEMAMKKSYFPLTAFLAKDPKYSGLWSMIIDEFERTKKYLQKLSGDSDLMQHYPVEALSIQMRERIVLPLTTIQQYALACMRSQPEMQENEKAIYEKLVIRSSFGIINAGRNSV